MTSTFMKGIHICRKIYFIIMEINNGHRIAIITGIFSIITAIISGIFLQTKENISDKGTTINGNQNAIINGNNNIISNTRENSSKNVIVVATTKNVIEKNIIGKIKPYITKNYLLTCLGVSQEQEIKADCTYGGKDIVLYFYSFDNLYITALISNDIVIGLNFELKNRTTEFPINTIQGKTWILGKISFGDVLYDDDKILYTQGGNKFTSTLTCGTSYPQYIGAGPYYYIWNSNDFKNISNKFENEIHRYDKKHGTEFFDEKKITIDVVKKCRITSLTILGYEYKELSAYLNSPMSQFHADIEFSTEVPR